MGRRQALIAAALLVLASSAEADDIKASVPAGVVGDGRTSVPVVVNGVPAGGGKALPVTEVPVVTCTGAPTLAAIGNALPAVLAPAVTASQTIECSARQRESTTAFQLGVRAPGPGLYASTERVARTTDGEAKLSAFVWDGKQRAVPSWLKAAASDGTVAIGKGGVLTLDLSGKAPRTVAIAMIDGERVGAAFVPVTGSTLLPVEAETGSSVQVWVAGTWYGPVETKGKLAEVPIDVPAGVTHGVARSTDKRGYTSDVVIDLKIPARPRIAVAAAAPSIGIGETTTLAVAVAGPDARPAAAKTKLVATAERGAVAVDKALGGGLWTLRYTAPAGDGADRISVRVDGDERAGTAQVELVVRGTAAKIEVDLPPAFEPGSELTGTVRVIDAGGIVLREPDIGATLGGQPVEIVAGDTLTLAGTIPEKAPASGMLPLEIASGSVRIRRDIFIGGAPTAVQMSLDVEERNVRADIRVLDRHGNLSPEGTFVVDAVGGELNGLRREGDHYVAAFTAGDDASELRIRVRAGNRSLAEVSTQIEVPGAIGIGAWLSGGYLDNLGAWASPRASVGAALKRRFAAIEGALLVGVEGIGASDSLAVAINGTTQDATRSITGIGVPVAVRARFPLGKRLGVAASAAFVPARMRVELGADSQMTDSYAETVLGVRGQLAGDVRVGPGRVVLGVAFGHATLADGSVVGQVDGLAVSLGYEWWFGAFVP